MLPTFLLSLHLLPSLYLLYIFSVSTTYQGTTDVLHTPSLSLRTTNHSRKLLLSHVMGKQTKSQKSNHISQAAQRAGAVVQSGTQGHIATSPSNSLSNLHIKFSNRLTFWGCLVLCRCSVPDSYHLIHHQDSARTLLVFAPLFWLHVMLLGLPCLWEFSRPQISTQQGTCLTFLSYFLQKPEGVAAEVGAGCICY